MEKGDNKYLPLDLYQIALNTDGGLFGNLIIKVPDYVHITIDSSGNWQFDGPQDWLINSIHRNESTGWYDYDQFVRQHPDWQDK